MTAFNPRLLTPPEEEEIFPYRRVWRSYLLEIGVLLAITAVLFVLFGLVGVRVPERFGGAVGVLLALAPVFLWLLFSWLGERFAPQPRQRLLTVAIISALAANAIGIPLIDDFFQVGRWLPLSDTLTRLVGYTFTVGLVQELIKYLVLRYVTWPDCFRTRTDGIAYGLASAIGYSAVLNLHYVFDHNALPDLAAMRIFATVAVHYAASTLVGFGLAEIRFSRPSPLLPMLTIALASTLTGVAVPLRAGLVNAELTLADSSATPLFGLGLGAALVAGIAAAVAFLIENSERREREAASKED